MSCLETCDAALVMLTGEVLWLHLLSVFEVCFEGVAETFGVFHKLLFLVLQSLNKQEDTQKRHKETRGK